MRAVIGGGGGQSVGDLREQLRRVLLQFLCVFRSHDQQHFLALRREFDENLAAILSTVLADCCAAVYQAVDQFHSTVVF